MRIKCVFGHTKRVVLPCCERFITFVAEVIWRVTYIIKSKPIYQLKWGDNSRRKKSRKINLSEKNCKGDGIEKKNSCRESEA